MHSSQLHSQGLANLLLHEEVPEGAKLGESNSGMKKSKEIDGHLSPVGQWPKPCFFAVYMGILHNFTTHLYGDYNKPI